MTDRTALPIGSVRVLVGPRHPDDPEGWTEKPGEQERDMSLVVVDGEVILSFGGPMQYRLEDGIRGLRQAARKGKDFAIDIGGTGQATHIPPDAAEEALERVHQALRGLIHKAVSERRASERLAQMDEPLGGEVE